MVSDIAIKKNYREMIWCFLQTYQNFGRIISNLQRRQLVIHSHFMPAKMFHLYNLIQQLVSMINQWDQSEIWSALHLSRGDWDPTIIFLCKVLPMGWRRGRNCTIVAEQDYYISPVPHLFPAKYSGTISIKAQDLDHPFLWSHSGAIAQ